MSPTRSGACRAGNCGVLIAFLFVLAGTWTTPSTGLAQSPEKTVSLPGKSEPETGREVVLPGTEEEIDEEIERLRTRLPEIRSRTILSPSRGIPGVSPGISAGTPEGVTEWQRANLEYLSVLENHLKALQDLQEIRKANRESAAEREEWRGFAEKPPFPVSFVEGLFDAIKARQFEQRMRQVRLKIVEDQFREYEKKLEDAGKELRIGPGRPDAGREPGTGGSGRWAHDLAKLRYELAEEGVLSSEVQRLVLEEDLAGRREHLPFLKYQYRLAEAASPLSAEDRDRKIEELETRKRSLMERRDHALREQEASNRALEEARNSVQVAKSDVASEPGPSAKEEQRLDHLKEAQEAEKTVLTTIGMKIDVHQGILRFVNVEKGFWEDRFRLGGPGDPGDLSKRSGEVRQTLEHIRYWKDSLEDGLDKLAPLLRNRREALSAGILSREQERIARRVIASYVDREALYRFALKELNRLERVTERWEEDLTALGERLAGSRNFPERLKSLVSPLRRIWDAELYVAEESTIVEGKKISRPIGVTLGKVSKAILIFLAGVWAAARMRPRLERFAVRRFRLEESAARQTGRKWSFFTVFGLLALALSTLNIPLAVFAFFGGTLAIAVGFGAQHLIGNFISSVILLFDRAIQIGDVVEIDGYRGQVTDIGLRSSSILRFDGVEMLVPNSQFLEQRVTNWTHSHKRVRYEITVGVGYRSPTNQVSETILTALREDPDILNEPAPLVIFEEFGESALVFRILFWLLLETETGNEVSCSNVRHRIKEALDRAGIEISYPQRDIHLDAMDPLPVRVVSPRTSSAVPRVREAFPEG